MSYLHCPVCSRAFNLAQHPACPHCPSSRGSPGAAPVDPVADLVAAVESLARALAQATPEQRATAAARTQLPALSPSTPLAMTAALRPADETRALAPAPRRSRWLATLAAAALDRLAPHAPKRLLRAVHAGVKAFAA